MLESYLQPSFNTHNCSKSRWPWCCFYTLNVFIQDLILLFSIVFIVYCFQSLTTLREQFAFIVHPHVFAVHKVRQIKYQSIYLPMYLSIYLSSIYLSIYPSIHIYLSIYQSSIYLSIHLSIYLSSYLSINLSIYLSNYPTTN